MHFPRHGSAAMRSLVAVLVLLVESGKLSTAGAPEDMMQSSEAANIKVPGDETLSEGSSASASSTFLRRWKLGAL